VEVWVNYYALPHCKRVFNSFSFVSCNMFVGDIDVQTHDKTSRVQSTVKPAKSSKATDPIVITGFEAKLHALLQTTLQHVLFLDADNIVTRDVSEVFRNAGFLRTGNCSNSDFSCICAVCPSRCYVSVIQEVPDIYRIYVLF